MFSNGEEARNFQTSVFQASANTTGVTPPERVPLPNLLITKEESVWKGFDTFRQKLVLRLIPRNPTGSNGVSPSDPQHLTSNVCLALLARWHFDGLLDGRGPSDEKWHTEVPDQPCLLRVENGQQYAGCIGHQSSKAIWDANSECRPHFFCCFNFVL